MRIISNFKDYYDSIQRLGIDVQNTYVRKVELNEVNKFAAYLPRIYTNSAAEFSILGFCGEAYVLTKHYDHQLNRLKHYTYLHSYTEVLQQVEGLDDPYRINKLKSSFDKVENKDWGEVFREFNTPIFHIRETRGKVTLETNISLRELNYQKIEDPYTAYQKIAMYRSGVLGVGTPEMVEIEDKYKIEAHGFDKRSFRKSKSILR